MKKIWIDYMAPCDIFFFESILKDLNPEYRENIVETARAHAETECLLTDNKISAKIIGEHDVSNGLSQLSSFTCRNLQLYLKVPKFDISLSLANIYAIIVSNMRFKPSISIIDNDLIEYERSLMETVAAKIHARAHWIIAPKAYPVKKIIEKGAPEDRVFTFDGFKEDISIANFHPDQNFLDNIPFKDFIVIRPEALYSTYVHTQKSVTPLLLEKFSKENINIVYLPRHKNDLAYMNSLKNTSNIFIPPKALNGLDLVYYSNGILTGSGTFAREGACMGKPAVSFFPDKLLAVDKYLIDHKKMFHSLDPDAIVDYILANNCTSPTISFENNKRIKFEFMKIVHTILESE